MNGIPEPGEWSPLVKRALLTVAVLAALIAGTALLIDLNSTERVTVTFEEDTRVHVSQFTFEHQTADARSGRTVITNSRDGVSPTNRSLRIMFREPKERVSIYASTPAEGGALFTVFGLDRNGERITSPGGGGVEREHEWVPTNAGGGSIHGLEITARGIPDGEPVVVWADDLSFRGPPPTISEDVTVIGLAIFWVFGSVTLLVSTGLIGRIRAIFDGNR